MAEIRDPSPPPEGFHRHAPEAGSAEWATLERDPDFRELVRAKRRFIIPATLFFLTYYFALPVLVGYWPELMGRPVIGRINIAYLFALSQFLMAWALMVAYIRRARVFDAMVARTVARVRAGGR